MRTTILVLLLVCTAHAQAQNDRINNRGTIGWYNTFGTFKLSDKWGVHAEYQWRRDNLITDWQQSLVRAGMNYQLKPTVLLRVGYAWIETFPYGELPLNGLGRDFTEHRTFQMVQLTQKEGIFDLSHRFMLEQRFVGRYSSAAVDTEDEFPLLHRARYMVRIQAPLKGTTIADKTPYAAVYNEVFIGFGKNVNANVFDQNRLGMLLGYRFNGTVRVEAGYLNQIVQFGRRIEGRNVFQNNQGLIVNAYVNFDLSKKQK
ncbi:MAG: DUF2490 domain-containing protein [Flavobacteriales bacterium]|nr:DUF2490 domain-containing protein [Flavobacteriales bacterium]